MAAKPDIAMPLIHRQNLKVYQIALRLKPRLKSLLAYIDLTNDRYHYNYFFRRSVFAAIVLILLLNVLFDWLSATAPFMSTDSYAIQSRNLSDNTLIVINAVPRTSLAQKRVKVPVIREVAFTLEEIDLPEIEFGVIEIGPEQKAETGGEGTTTGKLPYRRPELLLLVPPIYPRDAEKKGIEGTVGLRLLVNEKGGVDKVEVEFSSGNSQMDKAAVKAARKTRFRPAIKDGQRVAMWINYPIQFSLSKKNN